MSFRILSIDGGGIRGIVAARMLDVIEQQLNQPLREYFDLITGTSTGALIAGSLMVGRSPAQLVDLYLARGKEIFPYRSWFSLQRLPLLLKYGLSAPKFSDQGLIEVVRSQGLDFPIAAVSPDPQQSTKLMIISYDTVRRLPVFFKSWRHEEWYANVPLWQACVCSAAAPTYFPAQLLQIPIENEVREFSMIDGGVGANNPVACAVAEAIRLLRSGPIAAPKAASSMDRIIDEIKVLSLGTGELERGIPWREVRGWGPIQWAPRIVDVIMDAPADIHRYIAEQIVTKAGTEDVYDYLRLQPELAQKFGAIDNANPAYLQQLLIQTDEYLTAQADQIKAFFT
ncbi:MAG: patatin-like phospholipase family protein [Thainema sp.]